MRIARWESVSIAVLAALFAAVLTRLASTTGITVDEPSHLVSSYLYWQGRDVLEPGDLPPLIKITGGWVPVVSKLQLPPREHPVWNAGHEWNIALQMMDGLKDPAARRVFFWSRLALLIFPVGTLLLLWWWARQLFSPFGGLAAAAVFALSPTVLGHGALFKNDLAATFGYLTFWFTAWRFAQSPGLARAAWLGLALLASLLAKFSMSVLVPAAFAIVLWGGWRARGVRGAAWPAATLALVVYLGVLAAWQFHVEPVSPEILARWKQSQSVPAWLASSVAAASAIPAPPRLWTGAMSLVQSNAESGPVYLLGQLFSGGHPLYFVIAWAVKAPVAAQLLVVSGMLLCAAGTLRGLVAASDLFWVLPGFFYFALASQSGLQLGLRLVLPVFPFLAMFAGKAASVAGRRPTTAWLPVAAIACLAGNAVLTFPHYLSHFNRWVGGPDNGLRYLSDSNIDWGQDLPFLESAVREHRIPKIRLAYFGTDNPYAYLSNQILETIAPPWDGRGASERFVPEPGYYAVSATLLTGQFFAPRFRGYYDVFRQTKPIAKAGYSIFIYRVP